METAEQVNAIAQLPPDLAIMRMENENIQALAAAKPRDHAKIRKELAAQIDAYPSFVRTAIYCKPVGKDQDTGQMKYARGLSIRAAEAIAEAYGFCRIRADVTPLDDNTVKVEATFSDYQKGRIWQDGGVLSKFYRAKSGQMQRIPDDRFFNVTVKAEVSKRIREVILRSVPPGLRSELTEMVETRIDDLLDDSTVAKIVSNFANKGVTAEMLESRIGRSMKAGWTKEDRKNLIGLWNALEQEETTVAEIIGDEKGHEANGNGKSRSPLVGSVSSNDLTGNVSKATAAPGEAEKAPEDSPNPTMATEKAGPTQTVASTPGSDKPKVGQWKCMDPDCGAVFDAPRRIQRGKTAGTLICTECASKNILQVQEADEPDLSDVKLEEVNGPKPTPIQGKCTAKDCKMAGRGQTWGKDGICQLCSLPLEVI